MFATEDLRNFARETTENLTIGVDHDPLALNVLDFGRIRFHLYPLLIGVGRAWENKGFMGVGQAVRQGFFQVPGRSPQAVSSRTPTPRLPWISLNRGRPSPCSSITL